MSDLILPGGGGLIPLDKQSVLGVTEHDIALPAGFNTYLLIISKMKPQTSFVQLGMRFSSDGGASFKQGATDYGYSSQKIIAVTESFAGSTGAPQIGLWTDQLLNIGVGNAPLRMWLTGVRDAAMFTSLSYEGSVSNVDSRGTGSELAAAAVDAVRFFRVLGTGTMDINSELYGLAV